MTNLTHELCALFERIHAGATLTDVIPDAEPILQQAYGIMLWGHVRQFRKDPGNRPYSQHPLQVCLLVRMAGGTIEQQIAALLHDVVEDADESWSNTDVAEMMDAILRLFGEKVADMVFKLTDTPGIKREVKDAWQMTQMRLCTDTRLVKAADKICNAYDTMINPPAHWDDEKVQRKRCGGQKVVEVFPDLPDIMRQAAAQFAAAV